MVWIWTILARMITLGGRENGVLVASCNINEGHVNASEEGIEDEETVVDEVEVDESIEHGWVVVDTED